MFSKVPQHDSGGLRQSGLGQSQLSESDMTAPGFGQPNDILDEQTNPDSAFAFEQLVQRLMPNYEVPDILMPSSTLVFILESPHVQELEFGAPVSGLSGLTMTRHLFGEEYARFALGRLVKKNADEQKHKPRLDRMGLMNVANVPLQSAAYRNPELVKQHQVWFRAMAMVRQSNQRDTYKDSYAETVQTFFALSLRQKLMTFRDRSLTFVPCGRFAQKFFRLADVDSPNWQIIRDVPHPSYNSWDRAQYGKVIGQIREVLDR
jgi:hypothetical protein